MTRTEFIDTLQRALAGRMSSSTVNENIRYYQEYIDTQVCTGRKEEEVIEELGDPRLIAKTIIEAGKQEGRSYDSARTDYDEVYEDGSHSGTDESGERKTGQVPGWVAGLLILLFIIGILGIVGSIVTTFLPIIIPIACIVLMIKLLQRK